MADLKERTKDTAKAGAEGISIPELADRLGEGPAQELFDRIDVSSRKGRIIVGTNVRQARIAFSKVHKPGHVQFVVPGRSEKRGKASSGDFSDSVVILRFEDLEAVVKAAQDDFSWAREFAPRRGLEAATKSPTLKRGSQGRRLLRA